MNTEQFFGLKVFDEVVVNGRRRTVVVCERIFSGFAKDVTTIWVILDDDSFCSCFDISQFSKWEV